MAMSVSLSPRCALPVCFSGDELAETWLYGWLLGIGNLRHGQKIDITSSFIGFASLFTVIVGGKVEHP